MPEVDEASPGQGTKLRAQKERLTLAYVQSVLEYCPESGLLAWLPRDDDLRWTRRYSGKSAGSVDRSGYILVKLKRHRYLAHQLAWMLATGDWPASEIDHKNGQPTDNRFSNLRLATRSQNNRNRAKNKPASSPLKGVGWHKATGKWQAQIAVNGKKIYLGMHSTQEAAYAAYAASASLHFGEFVRVA